MSYRVLDEDGVYHSSLVKTYQTVTGIKCISSMNYNYARDRYDYQDGYVEDCECYHYEYSESQYKKYENYLIKEGFEYDGMEEFDEGISHYFYNPTSFISIELYIMDDQALFVYPTTF